jgi:hypothetical protein
MISAEFYEMTADSKVQDPPPKVVEQTIEQELRLEEIEPKSYVFYSHTFMHAFN